MVSYLFQNNKKCCINLFLFKVLLLHKIFCYMHTKKIRAPDHFYSNSFDVKWGLIMTSPSELKNHIFLCPNKATDGVSIQIHNLLSLLYV